MTRSEFDTIVKAFPPAWKYGDMDTMYLWNHVKGIDADALRDAAVEMAGQTSGYVSRPKPAEIVRATQANAAASRQQPGWTGTPARPEVVSLVCKFVQGLCSAQSRVERLNVAEWYLRVGPGIWTTQPPSYWDGLRRQFGLLPQKAEEPEPANW